MHSLRNYLPLSIAAFLLIASSMTGSFGCGSSSSPTQRRRRGRGCDGRRHRRQQRAAPAAARPAPAVVTGTDAGADVRRRSGAGGTIVIPDGGPNNFTCAELLACCNSGTGTLKTMCLAQYNSVDAAGRHGLRQPRWRSSRPTAASARSRGPATRLARYLPV